MLSYIDYYAEVWVYHNSNEMNTTQKVMHYFIVMNTFTPTHALCGEFGWAID